MGDCFAKNCRFMRFSSVIINFFLMIELISFIDPRYRPSESLMLEVAKGLKLTLFSVRSLKSLTPGFFQILTTGTKEFF